MKEYTGGEPTPLPPRRFVIETTEEISALLERFDFERAVQLGSYRLEGLEEPYVLAGRLLGDEYYILRDAPEEKEERG
jgi:hypothetical protein